MESIRQGAGRVALVYGSIYIVDRWGAGPDACQASGAGHERSGGRTADGPKDGNEAARDAGEGRRVGVLLVLAVGQIRGKLADINLDRAYGC